MNPKAEIAHRILELGTLFLHILPNRIGVRVPTRFVDDETLVLRLSRQGKYSVPDLWVKEFTIGGTIRFMGTPFTVNVPWGAVFALTDEHGNGQIDENLIPEGYKKTLSNLSAAANDPNGRLPKNVRGRKLGWVVLDGGRGK
jgi:stringent starvation protein B